MGKLKTCQLCKMQTILNYTGQKEEIIGEQKSLMHRKKKTYRRQWKSYFSLNLRFNILGPQSYYRTRSFCALPWQWLLQKCCKAHCDSQELLFMSPLNRIKGESSTIQCCSPSPVGPLQGTTSNEYPAEHREECQGQEKAKLGGGESSMIGSWVPIQAQDRAARLQLNPIPPPRP